MGEAEGSTGREGELKAERREGKKQRKKVTGGRRNEGKGSGGWEEGLTGT